MKMEKTILSVLPEDTLKRIDTYLSEKLPKFSRSFFKNLIETANIKVNNAVISKPGYNVKLNDIIEVFFPLYENIQMLDENQDLGVRVIYEHKDFLILYKPAHLIVHKPHLKSKELTLVDWIGHNFKDLTDVGSTDRPGIVHRLDKDTSGLIIVAKNNYAHMTFAAMFKDRLISKTYYAIVSGHPEASGIINEKISRDPINRNKMSTKYGHGRDALTYYKVIKYLKNSALVQVNPITGRTHQIRVHFLAIGHPLIGDILYNESSKLIDRQALHAQRLSFVYDDIYYSFSINLPEDMAKLIDKLDVGNEISVDKN